MSPWSEGSVTLSCTNGCPTVTVVVAVAAIWLPPASYALSSTLAMSPAGGSQSGALSSSPTYTLTAVAYSSRNPRASAGPASSPQPMQLISAALGAEWAAWLATTVGVTPSWLAPADPWK